MLRPAAGLALCSLVASLSMACSASPDEGVGEGTEAISDGVAKACMQAPDPTSCLGAKANAKLAAALGDVEAELRDRKLLAASEKDHYRIRTMPSCFDLEDEKAVQAAWDQMKASVDFLAEFHRDRRGMGNRWFSDVVVCNAKDLDDNSLVKGGLFGGELRLEGSSLQVGVKRGVLGGFKIQKGLEIRDRWDKGEHIAKTALDDDKGIFRTKAWPVMNPVGTLRLQALPGIRQAADALVQTLKGIRATQDLAKQKAALLAAVQSNTSVSVSIDGATLGEKAEKAIADADAGTLATLIDQWTAFLSGEAAADDAHEAIGAVHQGAAGRACNVDVKQVCVVAVNNAHCIDVSLTTGARLITRFVANEAAQQTNSVKVTQKSLVCVQTNDFVDVNVTLSADRALASAGLGSALGVR
jgi:hypothetical protein